MCSSDRKRFIVLQVKTMSSHHRAAGTRQWKSRRLVVRLSVAHLDSDRLTAVGARRLDPTVSVQAPRRCRMRPTRSSRTTSARQRTPDTRSEPPRTGWPSEALGRRLEHQRVIVVQPPPPALDLGTRACRRRDLVDRRRTTQLTNSSYVWDLSARSCSSIARAWQTAAAQVSARASAVGRRVSRAGGCVARYGESDDRPPSLRPHRARELTVIFGAAALGEVSQPQRTPRSRCCSSTGSTTSTPRRATATRSSGSRPGCASTGRFFLATKTGERTYAAAREEIRRSLERMGVDQVDLIQLHCLVHPAEWEVALGEDGALRAAVEAREEGLVRFIGVTGHGLTVAEMHRRSLERFPFDSVLFPYSHVIMQDAQYARDVERLLATCRERDVAVQTIKGIARGPWGSTTRRPGPGTSRCSSRSTSTSRSTGSSESPACSSTAPAISSCSPDPRRGRAARRPARRGGDAGLARRSAPQHPLRLTRRCAGGLTALPFRVRRE